MHIAVQLPMRHSAFHVHTRHRERRAPLSADRRVLPQRGGEAQAARRRQSRARRRNEGRPARRPHPGPQPGRGTNRTREDRDHLGGRAQLWGRLRPACALEGPRSRSRARPGLAVGASRNRCGAARPRHGVQPAVRPHKQAGLPALAGDRGDAGNARDRHPPASASRDGCADGSRRAGGTRAGQTESARWSIKTLPWSSTT